MKEKTSSLMPILLMVVFAMTRWPELMPPNFSAAYSLAFCAGVYFPGRMAWWLPLAAFVVTDILLNLYYSFDAGFFAFQPFQLFNYAAYAVLIWLGRRIGSRASWVKLVGGGLFGAFMFYLLTNTAAWFFNPFGNPEYSKDLAGWIIALTKGTGGWPQTWELFRNTLLSGGLFTGLFVGAMKASESPEPSEETEPEAEAEEAEPDESKA